MVLKTDNTTYSSDLTLLEKPNATFFDFLTIDLLELGSGQVKLIAWPNGMLDSAAVQSPISGNISSGETFRIYLKCTGTCAATYIGIYAISGINLSRIGFYNNTNFWNGWQVVNMTTSIPEKYANLTIDVKILADTRNSRNAYYWDTRHPPEFTLSKNYDVH
jgi:hypothetical protein